MMSELSKGERVSSTKGTDFILCPWFRAHGQREVQCAGPVDGSHLIFRFSHAEELKQHERIFCKARYLNCEVCRVLDELDED